MRMVELILRYAFLLCAFATTTGCTDDTKLEGSPVELNVDGKIVTLQMGDCRIYKVTPRLFRSDQKTRVLSSDFYLGFTVCSRQSLYKSGEYAIASLCRQGIGAGGGCASSGTYRTRDGYTWEKEALSGTWIPVESP